MEAMNQGSLQRQGQSVRGRVGGISERAAQVIALLITLTTFGTIGFAIDALFKALGQQ